MPIPGKIIRVNAGEKSADVRVKIGRSETDVSGVPFKSIFDPDVVFSDDDQE